MAYFEQKILSAVPGGESITDVESTGLPVNSDAFGSDYLGAYHIDTEGDRVKTANKQVYFELATRGFRRKGASTTATWLAGNPTDDDVFGTIKTYSDPNIPPKTVVWLGSNQGATGSANVEDYASVRAYFHRVTYSDSNVYYFYNNDTGNVEQVDAVLSPNNIEIIKGSLEKSYINKAVTFGKDFTWNNPKVGLARDNDMVLGAILGYSYNKLQIAVEGWDISFINGTSIDLGSGETSTRPLTIGSRIVGASINDNHGYVQDVPDLRLGTSISEGNEDIVDNGRGYVVDSGYDENVVDDEEILLGTSIVKVSLLFGAW